MKLRLAENFRAIFYAPFYATQALGFYAREGLDIAFVDSSVPGDGAAGLLTGAVDLTWGGPMRVMKARDQDPASPLVCFGEVVARDPFYLVGRAPPAGFQFSDLARLRFATVSEVPTPWLCLQHDLCKHGLDPDRLDRISDRTMAENVTALREERIDVVQVFEPFVSQALADGADILYAASARGPTVYTSFIATRDGIARQREAFAAAVRAVARMQDWLAAHGAADLAAAVAPYYPDVAPDLLARALERYAKAGIWARTPAMSREGFSRLAESLVSGRFIARLPRFEDCVAERLAS